MGLFHITTRAAWDAATEQGSYGPASLGSEGFIHFSTDKQWLITANRFYRGQRGLVLLSVREDRLQAKLVFEPADGDLFPHLYGELDLDAVTEVFDLPLADDGTIGTPDPRASVAPDVNASRGASASIDSTVPNKRR